MLPFFFLHSKAQRRKPALFEMRPQAFILQTLKLISLSAFLITGSITVFSVAAAYLAVRPLDFTAPNALPIEARVGHSVQFNYRRLLSLATCIDCCDNGTLVRRCNG